MKIEIIDEQRQWLVANKPAGLAVHATSDKDEINLVDELSSDGPRLHPVHRLDRETSGLVFLAKTSAVASEIMALWTTDKVVKKYDAILVGALGGAVEGIWSWPLSDRSEGRQNPQGVKASRRDSKTAYKILQLGSSLTHVECELFTGRTHQIRRHAALAGHPVLGDRRYGGEVKEMPLENFALHAKYLKIIWRGIPLQFEVAAPKDFPKVV